MPCEYLSSCSNQSSVTLQHNIIWSHLIAHNNYIAYIFLQNTNERSVIVQCMIFDQRHLQKVGEERVTNAVAALCLV